MSRFSGLDGLRAISVLMVIWQHTAGFNDGHGILARGYLGVDTFFVISGFLITTLLLREHSTTGTISLRQFYLRRAARIFPVYYLVLSLYVVLVVATQDGTRVGDEFIEQNLLPYATYTSNWFGVGGDDATFYFAWSLATEEQFYLLWPPILVACLYFGVTRRRIATRTVAFAAGALVALVAVDQLATAAGWRIVASLATPILLGALAAVVMHTRRGYNAVRFVLGYRWTAPIAAVFTLAMIQLEVPDVAIQVYLAVVVVAVVVREDTALHPVLTWRPLVLVGVISYGVYLMHMLAANMVRPVLGHQRGADVFLATIPVVLVAAYASYRWFETPFREGVRERQAVRASA